MNDKSDTQLLREFAARRDEAAFREIVARNADLVYSSALRQVESSAVAADIAQVVFTDLAQKSTSLAENFGAGISLAGWLHRATRYASLNHLRDSRRRRENESQAMQQLLTDSEPSADWREISPVLDEALDSLGDDDREIVLLRYFKNQDFRSVGLALGVSDDTAQKRVSRAVEKLREFFARRKITVGASGLAVLISANAVQASPVGLAATISAAALAGTAVTTSTVIAATTKTIAMTTLQKTLITVTVAVLAGAGIYEARQAAQLRGQVQTLQQQQAPLDAQIQQLQQRIADATNRLSDLLAENKYLKSNPHETELLRLRGQVTQLKAAETEDLNDPIRVAAKLWAERVALLKKRFSNWSGRQTPEIALLTEQDWLDVAAKHKLNSEDDCRNAMSDIRTASIEKFAGLIKTAVKQYAETNSGQLPSSPSQLTPFVNLPLDLATAILSGYKVAAPGTVHPPNPGPSDSEVTSWAILQKDGPADPEYDHTYVFYTGGWYYYGPNKAR